MGVEGRASRCVISAAVLLETIAAARAEERGVMGIPILRISNDTTRLIWYYVPVDSVSFLCLGSRCIDVFAGHNDEIAVQINVPLGDTTAFSGTEAILDPKHGQ